MCLNTLDIERSQESDKWWRVVEKDIEGIEDPILKEIIQIAFYKIFEIVYSKGYTLKVRK